MGQTYLDGSAAKAVWIVNYEESTRQEKQKEELQEQDGRQLGIAYNFRPGFISRSIRDSVKDILRWQIGLPGLVAPPQPHYLVIDVSGSMNQKILPDLPLLQRLPDLAGVYWWRSEVKQIPTEKIGGIAQGKYLEGSGMEDSEAFATFALSLPEKARFTLITDISGKEYLAPYLKYSENPLRDRHDAVIISGRTVELILL